MITCGFRDCTHLSSVVIFGYLAVFCDHKVSKRSAVSMITDLARWCSCGVPSTWHSPTTRQRGGSPRRNRHVRRPALPPGWRVVALQEVEGMPRPDPPDQSQQFL